MRTTLLVFFEELVQEFLSENSLTLFSWTNSEQVCSIGNVVKDHGFLDEIKSEHCPPRFVWAIPFLFKGYIDIKKNISYNGVNY